MIDSNAAITVPSLWLEMISLQGFQQEDNLIGFRAMRQQSSSLMILHQAELTILIRG
jgi:hypothetical protein